MVRYGRALSRTAVLIGGACLCVTALCGRALDAQNPDVSALLDTYAAGQFQRAVEEAVGVDWKASLPALRAALKREAPAWAARDGEAELAHRRLLAATFALEVAHAVYADQQKRAGKGPLQHLPAYGALPGWSEVEPLVEWASGWLRQRKATDPLERDWFIASVQLLRDFQAPAVAVYAYVFVPVLPRERESQGHLRDAMDRFPDEPWFRVVQAERGEIAELTLRPGFYQQTVEAAYQKRPWPTGGLVRSEEIHETLALLMEMRKQLAPLESAPSVRAEVDVHLGSIALIFGERDKARAYFDDVDAWTTDPCLQYLGHYLHGHADEADDRLADAEQAYRRALVALPDVPSGLTSLAAMLALRDQPAEAATLARRVFLVPSTQLDPWIETLHGTGCTRWPAAIGRLHDGLRPSR